MLNRVLPLALLTSYVFAWKTFVVPHTDGQDDTPALLTALATGNYSLNATVLFAKGTKYNIFTPVKFPVLNNVEVRIEGNLSYPDDIATVQGRIILCFPSKTTHDSAQSRRRKIGKSTWERVADNLIMGCLIHMPAGIPWFLVSIIVLEY